MDRTHPGRTAWGPKHSLGSRVPLAVARAVGKKNGAEDGIRTRDLLLGKETLYH